MIIQHNIMALNSYNRLASNNSMVSKNIEKLSSGYKINRAGDDAAGLAISEKMRAQITGLERATQNAQDGISLVQTAEGNLTEVHSMLNRMVDLATQSSNGTYDVGVDRKNLQTEIQALKDEIDRIAESSNFNGIKLLDGSLGGGTTNGGLTGGKIVSFKPAAYNSAGTGFAADGSTLNLTDKDTIVVDGTEIEVDWSGLTADDKAAIVGVNWDSGTPTASEAKKAAAVLEKTINAAIDKKNASAGTGVNHISVKGDATGFTLTSGLKDNGGSRIDIKASTGGNTSVLDGLVSGQTNVTSGAPAQNLGFNPADLNGKFEMEINGEKFEIDMSAAALTATSTSANVITALNNAITATLTRYDTAKGNAAGSDEALSGKISAKLNNEGGIEFTNSTDAKIGFSDKDGGSIASTMGISSESKTSSGGLSLQIGDTAEQRVTVSIDSMSVSSLGLNAVDVSLEQSATDSIKVVKDAINTVSTQRAKLGAVQNRLEHTINNLTTTAENMTSAEARIRDTDMAKEMMHFTKNNVLAQAAQAMLAQANQQPQQVLQLLR